MPGKDFTKSCEYDYWLHSDSFFPIIARYYKCNVIWYDVEQNYTKACVCKDKNGKQKQVILLRKAFVPPKSLCVNLIWKLRVICIYYNNHYMCLNKYLKV